MSQNPEDVSFPGESDCAICYDTITSENQVAYQVKESALWFPSLFCTDCIQQLISTLYEKYHNDIKKCDCAKEMRALLKRGPPINIYDKHGFPECDENEVSQLFFENSLQSARLANSLIGEERAQLWDELCKQYVLEDATESAEGEEKSAEV